MDMDFSYCQQGLVCNIQILVVSQMWNNKKQNTELKCNWFPLDNIFFLVDKTIVDQSKL